jgi:predicted TPR repeat methyltransferase/Flp pilus assembly protein TadD
MQGRNALCPCGSGKKYKHCCLRSAPTPAAPASALDIYSGPARAAPADALEHCRRGLNLLGLNRPGEAILDFRQAIRTDPDLAPAHNYLGIALKDLGRLDEAVQSYRAALSRDPSYAPAHHNLGEALSHQGNVSGARACFERALVFDPQLPQSHLNLGNILTDSGELEAAIGHYRKVVAANWNLPAAYASLGTVLSLCGRQEESLGCFRTAAAIAPDSAEAQYNLARARLKDGDPAEALDRIQRAIDIKPAFPRARELRGAAYWCQGRLSEAVSSCREAFPDRNILQIYYTLGANLMTCGLHAKALTCFQKVLEVEPNQPTAQHFVAALEGVNPEHSAPEYVEGVFDDFAATFNEQLVETLRYTVPRDLAVLATELATRGPPWDVLDLGCGTGLFGTQIAAHRRHLVGIDLSAKMLDRARALGLYDRLERRDLRAALDLESPASFELVAAADVFIYVGKIDGVVSRVRALLRPGGLFVFSAEAGEQSGFAPGEAAGAGYRLSTTGRYIHEVGYLNRLAAQNGFEIMQMKGSPLRLENCRAAPGWLVVWQA